MKLKWHNDSNCYTAQVDGGTLFVGGDDYAESKWDMAQTYLLENHPELERGEPFHSYIRTHEKEWDACLDKAEDELNDSGVWEAHATTLEPGQELDDLGYDVSAWIEPIAEHIA